MPGGAPDLAIGAAIQDSFGGDGIVKTGGGILQLTGESTYDGETVVNQGTLQVGDGTSGSINGSSDVTVASGATLVVNQGDGTNFSPTIISDGAIVSTQAEGVTNTFSGGIYGGGGFTKKGLGTTILGGSNSYTGATLITAGKLDILGATDAGSSVTVGNNTAATAILAGSGIVGGSVTTVSSGGNVAYLAPGENVSGDRNDFGAAGTLTIGGDLTLSIGTNFDYDLDIDPLGANDLINVGGLLTFAMSAGSTTFNFSGSDFALNSPYTLIVYGSDAGFDPANFIATGLAPGQTAVFTDTGSAIDVTFLTASFTPTAYFNGNSSNSLNDTAAYNDTIDGTDNIPFAPTADTNVIFSNNNNTPISAVVNAPAHRQEHHLRRRHRYCQRHHRLQRRRFRHAHCYERCLHLRHRQRHDQRAGRPRSLAGLQLRLRRLQQAHRQRRSQRFRDAHRRRLRRGRALTRQWQQLQRRDDHPVRQTLREQHHRLGHRFRHRYGAERRHAGGQGHRRRRSHGAERGARSPRARRRTSPATPSTART